MNDGAETTALSPALEDYLETVWLILQENKVARVKEIAETMGVKMASVTPAMKRLQKMGLVEYSARSFVDLTDAGAEIARRVHTRHGLLTRFLHEFLQVPAGTAEEDACAIEHHLSNTTIERMVRWFEFLELCSESGAPSPQARFHACHRVHPELEEGTCACEESELTTPVFRKETTRYASSMQPGDSGRILQIMSEPAMRSRLIDRGLVPNALIRMLRVDPGGEPVWVELGGNEIPLTMKEAACVLIHDI